MDVLRKTVAQARIVGGSRRKAAYRKAKNVYRPPLGIIGEIIAELILTYGCNVCFCSYQADTCITRCCAQAAHPEDLYVVSGDSDMITFKSIPRFIYPLGKLREMTVIEKADLLRVMELPSDNHLLLAAIVAGNDYTSGVPYYGLSRSCDIIQSMDLPSTTSSPSDCMYRSILSASIERFSLRSAPEEIATRWIYSWR
jgi:5'-3' exonuclease